MLRQSAELGLHVENAERNLKLSAGLSAAQVALEFQELTHVRIQHTVQNSDTDVLTLYTLK